MMAHAESMCSLHGGFTEKGINVRATGGCIRGSTPTGSLSLFILYQRHLIRGMGRKRTTAYRLKESLLDESRRETRRSALLLLRRRKERLCNCAFHPRLVHQKNACLGWLLKIENTSSKMNNTFWIFALQKCTQNAAREGGRDHGENLAEKKFTVWPVQWHKREAVLIVSLVQVSRETSADPEGRARQSKEYLIIYMIDDLPVGNALCSVLYPAREKTQWVEGFNKRAQQFMHSLMRLISNCEEAVKQWSILWEEII